VTRRERADRADQGAASLLTVAVGGLLVLVGAALSVVGAMVVAHRQAQSAADLAALAAATTLADGGDACGTAGSWALANGADLAACAVDGREVRVRVVVTGPRWLGQVGDLEAEARAGPG
jgi:secretion/DNA translocation related TadE-like protein